MNNLLLKGKLVNIRTVEETDAAFILSLRCDEEKSKFLHPTENNLSKQVQYINTHKSLDNEWYFIITNKQNKPIGTYRIYDLRKDSFCIGSWLMVKGATAGEVLEGDFLAKTLGFEKTGFSKFHFDVRKANKKVVKYHLLMGAQIVGENEQDYFFECTKEAFLKNKPKFLALL